jgi:membrane associated rhomboid family serine protease
MEIHIPDPAHTDSAQTRVNFRRAVVIALSFAVLIWVIQWLNWALDLELQRFGVRPRQWAGLPGIFLAPLLHSGFAHLVANSLPLLVAGTTMLHLYPNAARSVLPAIYLGPGIAVWLFARESVHIGASGLVYGLVCYVFVAGLIRRDRRAIAASLLVAFLYGSMAWGVLPMEPQVSWETHLAAAWIGVLMAIVLRDMDVPPRVRYAWEDEGDDETTSTLTPFTAPQGGAGLPRGGPAGGQTTPTLTPFAAPQGGAGLPRGGPAGGQAVEPSGPGETQERSRLP